MNLELGLLSGLGLSYFQIEVIDEFRVRVELLSNRGYG